MPTTSSHLSATSYCIAESNDIQPNLFDIRPWMKPAWTPQAGLLYRIKDYFGGYMTAGKQIFCRRRHAAAKLGISVRTLARYLRHLSEVGWMVTIQRKARTAIRQVIVQVTNHAVPSAVPSVGPGPSYEATEAQTRASAQKPRTPRKKPVQEDTLSAILRLRERWAQEAAVLRRDNIPLWRWAGHLQEYFAA